jgi:hypothetical protein
MDKNSGQCLVFGKQLLTSLSSQTLFRKEASLIHFPLYEAMMTLLFVGTLSKELLRELTSIWFEADSRVSRNIGLLGFFKLASALKCREKTKSTYIDENNRGSFSKMQIINPKFCSTSCTASQSRVASEQFFSDCSLVGVSKLDQEGLITDAFCGFIVS